MLVLRDGADAQMHCICADQLRFDGLGGLQWEIRQLIASGVLKPEDYPTFDEETGGGLMARNDDDVEADFEVDINEAEPLFLKGHTQRSGIEMSPIRIVKNPDGSMQRAALTQVCSAALFPAPSC